MVGASLENRSELSVGRVIAPLAWNVNDKLTLGASADFVWAGLDLKMAMSEAQFVDLATTQTIGEASGSLLPGFGALYEPFGATPGPGTIRTLNHAYYDFSNNNDFTGEAKAYGYAGKAGFVYQASSKLSFGASYHSKTQLGNLKTDDAKLLMGVEVNTGAGYSNIDIPVRGKIKVDNFQWPATWAAGFKLQATPKFMLAFDVKRLLWEDVMEDFTMKFTADSSQSNPAAAGFAGADITATLYQDWEDQTVYQVGGAYQFDKLTLRAGYNYAANPVPDEFLNALFPAIAENHLTGGFGYRFDDTQSIDFAVVKVFESDATNPGNGSTIPPVKSTHSQLNFQFLYTRRY
jgi:long-chain fatty acid transport protein